ncbi:hypothetical protein LBMAG53_27980 [Planctomycetota bacterium]|nr:hypothetical protein LBMAG53_27980 [Planctomycetota bacterium]
MSSRKLRDGNTLGAAPEAGAGRVPGNHPLVELIRGGRIFATGYLRSLDVDAVFSQWDADEAGHAAFIAIINRVGDQFEPGIQEIRDVVFDRIYAATQHHELAAYVCEEIGLIVLCHQLQDADPWLKERDEIYRAGRLPYAATGFRASPEQTRS